MARTPYEPKKKEDTDKAHLIARNVLYPNWFKCSRDKLVFRDATAEEDKEEKIDRWVGYKNGKFARTLWFPVQERFRNPKYSKYRDVTITAWNHISNQPAELYAMRAELFLYGYYDQVNQDFIEAIGFDWSRCKRYLLASVHINEEMNKKKQSFVTVSFDELLSSGVADYLYSGEPAKKKLKPKESCPVKITHVPPNYELRFKYDADFIHDLKLMPVHSRRYNKDKKCWVINELYINCVADFIFAHYQVELTPKRAALLELQQTIEVIAKPEEIEDNYKL